MTQAMQIKIEARVITDHGYYGPWCQYDENDEDCPLPYDVNEAAVDEVVEHDLDSGVVEVGGQTWEWRKIGSEYGGASEVEALLDGTVYHSRTWCTCQSCERLRELDDTWRHTR